MGKPGSATARRERARQMQMVFQDPYTILDPRQHVGEGLDEIQRLHFRRPPVTELDARRNSSRRSA